MAESKGSLIAKSVSKHAGRAKEKILQKVGRVDRTADDIFDEHLQNFNRQQNAANRLQKEFNNYIRSIRAAQVASKSLLECIGEIYESQWSGHDLLFVQTQSVDMLWQDFCHKLGDQVLIPLNTYQSQFPEMRKKIDKRGRKLVDYDGQRHSFQDLQVSMTKKRDEAKLGKGREQLEEAKRTYEILNSELHDELPALHDSRILFLVTNLQTLFNAENVFHSETAKIYGELEAIVDKLATESQRASYSVKKTNGTSLPHKLPSENSSPIIMNNISPTTNSSTLPTEKPLESPTTPKSSSTQSFTRSSSDVAVYPAPSTPPTPPASAPPEVTPVTSSEVISQTPEVVPQTPLVIPQIPESPIPEIPTTPPAAPLEINGNSPTPDDKIKKSSPSLPPISQTDSSPVNNANATNKRMEELYDIPVGASTDNLPPGVLYRVKATYKYNREDVDELSFDVGDIISVIEYDDPEEQEEGWLMGMKDNSNDKGMFPANFTRPL